MGGSESSSSSSSASSAASSSSSSSSSSPSPARRVKNSARVPFPLELVVPLTPPEDFTTPLPNSSPDNVNNNNNNSSVRECRYYLFAAVVHMGDTDSRAGGHYVTFAHHHRQWFLYDDANVRVVQEEDLEACFGAPSARIHQDAQLLLYRQASSEAEWVSTRF